MTELVFWSSQVKKNWGSADAQAVQHQVERGGADAHQALDVGLVEDERGELQVLQEAGGGLDVHLLAEDALAHTELEHLDAGGVADLAQVVEAVAPRRQELVGAAVEEILDQRVVL